MKVYISGKISGASDYLERFAQAEAMLAAKGYTVINPAKVCDHLPKSLTWEEYMAVTLSMLVIADAVYFLRGWRDSGGAVIERGVADDMGKEILWEE